MKQQCQLNKIIILLVLSAMGVIPNMLNRLTNLSLPPCLLSQVQNVVIINTCSTGRKFIIDEVRYSDEEADNP